MTFEIVKGNLFDPEFYFEALAQGVNTKGKMGAGIAVEFRTRWPEMYEDYKNLCEAFTDILPGMLHTFEASELREFNAQENRSILVREKAVIYNMFSQDWPGPHGDYEMLAKSALAMRMDAEKRKLFRVGLPWIGCGIAKLEKHNVQHFFERILGPSRTKFVLVEQ